MLLERYRVDALLGRGGFGITYRARDTRLHRDVAIKELFPPAAHRRGEAVAVTDADRPAFQAARARFQREAATLARFNHPGIVRIFEVFEANDTAYLVMELIEGASVGELLQRRGAPFEVDAVLDLVLRVGGALGAIHEAGLLHRDVNPSNVMVDDTHRVVLIDFGLARRFGDDISGSVTRAVTPGYAPPEQYAGSARIGPPSDVFGLAAMAYKLLTGTTPTNIFDRQAGTPLPAPATVRGDIPALVSAGILDGMELDPDHRPATAEAFLHRLGLFGVTPTAVAPFASPSSNTDHTIAAVASDVGGAASPAPAGAFDGDATGWVAVGDPPARVDPVYPGAAPIVVPAPAATAMPPSVVGTNAAFAPWHDGSPPVVGAGDRRRGWVSWPVGIALVALASASPIVVSVLVGLVLLPALATSGDLVVHHHRQRIGAQRRKWHDARPAVVGPVRFVRNVLVAAARALPAMAIAAVGFATERVFTDATFDRIYADLTIRCTGVAMALVLLVPARHGGRGFRTDLGITSWADRVLEGRRRPGSRAFVVGVVAVAATAFGLWLGPEMWPLT